MRSERKCMTQAESNANITWQPWHSKDHLTLNKNTEKAQWIAQEDSRRMKMHLKVQLEVMHCTNVARRQVNTKKQT